MKFILLTNMNFNWNLIITFETHNKTKIKPSMNFNQYENKSSSRCCTAEHYQNEHIKTQSNFAFKSIKFISINSAIEEQKIYIHAIVEFIAYISRICCCCWCLYQCFDRRNRTINKKCFAMCCSYIFVILSFICRSLMKTVTFF